MAIFPGPYSLSMAQRSVRGACGFVLTGNTDVSPQPPRLAAGNVRIAALQSADQRIVQLLTSLDLFPADLQQGANAVADLLVVGEQIAEVALLMQALLVVAH